MVADDTLAGVPLFVDLNADALQLLAACGDVRRHAPGAILWRRGERPRGLFVVLEGEVRVVREGDGRRRVIHTEGAGGTLGEIPLFEGTPYPATAIAARRTTSIAFDRDTIVAAMRADPGLALALLQRLAGRVRLLIDRLDRTAGQSVTARLAAFLSTRATLDAPFTLGCTQQEVAEELGTVREVIVRELRALCDSGILDRAGRGRYRVIDDRALRRLAGDA